MARIEQKDNGKKGRFVIYHDDAAAGVMTYVWVDARSPRGCLPRIRIFKTLSFKDAPS